MKKVIFLTAIMLVVSVQSAFAQKNPYNEMDYINLNNRTLADVAKDNEVEFEALKEVLNLPEDMAEDTNEESAFNFLSLKAVAEMSEMTDEEMLSYAKEMYSGDKEVTLDMKYVDFENAIPLSKYFKDNDIEEIKKLFELDESVTGDTLYSDVRLKIDRALLKASGVTTYDKGDSVLVMLKGKYIDFDVEPVIIDNRVMVPMRNIFESMGAVVNWMGDTKTIFAKAGENIITMQIGQKTLFKNNTSIEFDVAPVISGERALVPIRAVAEALDTEVFYNENTKTVVIH